MKRGDVEEAPSVATLILLSLVSMSDTVGLIPHGISLSL